MSCVTQNKIEKVKSAPKINKLDYDEMRLRLLETERKLQSLNRLEDDIRVQDSPLSDQGNKNRDILTEESEDLESVPSVISTVPGSYTGFAVNYMPSSTSSRFEADKSPNNIAGNFSHFDSDSSVSSVGHPKYDILLVKQNQRLLKEIERLIGQIHMTNLENAKLKKEADMGKAAAELEDRVVGLLAENQSHDKTLREAERHLDEGHRRNFELKKQLTQTENTLEDVRAELDEMQEMKSSIERQRDEAFNNLILAQDSLEEYQKKSKEKIMKMEVREDELQESLATTSQERDDLLDQLSAMKMSLASHETQINRLLNDINTEDAKAREMELSNQQLKKQLDLMTAQISDYEKKMSEAKTVEKERNFLQSELRGHHQLAYDLRQLLLVLNKSNSSNGQDDSGNFSFKSWPLESGAGEGGLLAAELNCNNNGLVKCETGTCEGAVIGKANMVCEMRNLVTNMDCEIQRLRSDLKQRDADDRTYSNLRDELRVLMDKVERGMSHNHDLENQVSCLETDKKNMMVKLEETLKCLEERDRTLQCLDTRLNERSTQIVCLQEDIDERNTRICCLEQQLHEIQKRMMSDCDKKDNSQPLKEALGRISELEGIILCKTKSLDELKEKLGYLMKELRTTKMDGQKQVECLSLELSDKQLDIDRYKEESESLRQKVSSFQRVMEDNRKLVRTKDETISCLSDEVAELKYAKERMEEMLTSQLDVCEKKLQESQDKCQELDNALAVCRKEVSDHLQRMDEIRMSFENELEQRDSCIRKLKEDLRRTVEELKCKIEDNNSLENSLTELRNKLQQMCCQLNEADGNINCLNAKCQEMEKLMLKEKSTWMKESEELERRLTQACNNLSVAHNEIDMLKQVLQEKKDQNDCLQAEKTHLCQEIKKLGDQLCNVEEQLKKRDDDNQELCRQLQQKMECIRDLENVVRMKDQELKCLTKYIQDQQSKSDSSDIRLKLETELKTLKEQLEKCREENQSKGQMLCECEEALHNCQLISRDKDDEIQMLKCQIENLNSKLVERISRVEELEKAIENLHKDVERRISRVDEQLKRYETELMDRLQEIGELKECVKTSQLNLSEKMDELNQQEHKIGLLNGELQSLKLQLKETEDAREHLNTQLTEKRTELAEYTQQLRINREQMQKQHEDLVQSRQTLSAAQRDSDKLRRELDDASSNLDHRDCEISRLNEERKILSDKVSQVTCQLDQETIMLRQQMSEVKCRMEKECECLRSYSCQLETNNTSLTQKLSLTQRQMMQVEKCFHQKLDCLTRDLDDLNTKLKMREDEIMACKDNISLKESEISRLKRRLCHSEKACTKSADCNANNNSNNLMYSRDSDDNEEEEDDNIVCNSDVTGSESNTNLTADWSNELINSNRSQNKQNYLQEDVHSIKDENQSPSEQGPSSSDASTRDSLGVTEVQERLRDNEMRQKEIERQLQTLEESTQDSMFKETMDGDEEG